MGKCMGQATLSRIWSIKVVDRVGVQFGPGGKKVYSLSSMLLPLRFTTMLYFLAFGSASICLSRSFATAAVAIMVLWTIYCRPNIGSHELLPQMVYLRFRPSHRALNMQLLYDTVFQWFWSVFLSVNNCSSKCRNFLYGCYIKWIYSHRVYSFYLIRWIVSPLASCNSIWLGVTSVTR